MDVLFVVAGFVLFQLAETAVFAYIVSRLLAHLREQSRFLAAAADVNAYVTSCRPEEPDEPPELTKEDVDRAIAETRPTF